MELDDLIQGLSIDCVIFGFHENQLKVLLLKFKSMEEWALPGGFILNDEHVNGAANRILKERTGIDKVFLQQFYFFGDANRFDSSLFRRMVDAGVLDENMYEWINQRFVTVGYYALVEYSKVNPMADILSDACEWVSLDELPKMILDHRQILEKALSQLRLHLNYQPIGKNLLPSKFTMPELQTLYETILGRPLDRRNFQRKILGYGIVRRLNETRKGGAHKAPYLYSFDTQNYIKALKEGLKTGW